MKIIRRLFAIMASLCLLTSCVIAGEYSHPQSVNGNYNNITANSSFFWFTQEGMYYANAPFKTVDYYHIAEAGTTKFSSAATSGFGRIQVCENNVYMLDIVDTPDDHTRTYRLRSYTAETQAVKEVCRLENVFRYFIFQNKLYYTQEDLESDVYRLSLHMYDLKTKNEICIHESVFSVGVMGNAVVYLVQEGTKFLVYSYGNEATKLGSFEYEVNEDMELRREIVNFTTDKIILTASGYSSSELVCFDITENKKIVYEIDGYIASAIAYENYAFIVAIDTILDDTNKQDNTILRLRLSDGSKEIITKLKGGITAFVDSDERVFIQTNSNNQICCYSVDGEKTLVYNGRL